MFVVFVAMLVLGLNTAIAQPVPTGMIHITAAVTTNPLTVTPGTLDFAGLSVGKCYKAPADPSGASPIVPSDAGAVTAALGETNILGDPGTSVSMQFVLPTRIYPTGGVAGGYIDLTYDNLSAAWGATAAESNYFNPENPLTVELDGTGNVFVMLSANPCVSLTAGADTYEGDAVIVVQYVGS